MNLIGKVFTLLLVLISAASFAQNKRTDYKLSHPLKFGAENQNLNPKNYDGIPDTFKVVAIMADFQLDDAGQSTGNGKFDLSNKYLNPSTGRDTIIDSPPYDSLYFADHLKFLKNYFEKVSDGKVVISYELFGSVIHLPNKMQDYSPQRNENLSKLGNLFKDAWARADSVINFSSYDPNKTAFVVFHAGTGRDVDLTSIFGFDPTPFDLPSVYLGLKNLQEFFGSSYNGYQTSEGFLIKNSLIIPSTEVRELNLTSGKVILELGMNGILTASFGSFLGLPDLFNTNTGKTAIGRFGLMDGQSIFSFNGLFPPEPSAWEKVYLGWVSPITISSGEANVRIKTSSGNTANNDSTMYKVLINSREYFLIENRNRDYLNNGQKLYIRNKAFNDVNTYQKDVEDFIYFNTSAIGGNIVDVEDLDWSLPGLINDTIKYRGGVLIWHIDENVINANFASNTINNNIDHKGIDLEEAKGAQELGVTFNSPFGAITGDGTIVDYWFNGNHYVPSTIYKNAFTPTSIPNSLSYSLANSGVNITDFSAQDTLMTFKISIGGSFIKPLTGFPKFVGIDTSGNAQPTGLHFSSSTYDDIFVNANNDGYGFKSNGSNINNQSNGMVLPFNGKYILGGIQSTNYRTIYGLGEQSLASYNSNNLIIVPVVPIYTGNSNAPTIGKTASQFFYASINNGSIYRYEITSIGIPQGVRVDSLASPVREFAKTLPDSFTFANANNKFIATGNLLETSSFDVLTVNNSNEMFVNGNKLPNNYGITNIISSPALADINNDGRQEIIFNGDNKVYAMNSAGTILENFPVNFNQKITSGISVADVNNDGIFDLLFTSESGDLFAYGTNGKVVAGFPVKAGINSNSTPALANLNDTLGILAYGRDGYLYAFKTSTVYNESKVLWKNYLKDNFHSNSSTQSNYVAPSYTEKLPKDKVYNWPNPVYDGKTYIRYYLNGSASVVSIKILDLSGELVTSLPSKNISNADNEVVWDVSTVQSGVYYGVIEATIDGAKETKIIKIAVVK
ncbi:MAG: hypothetical protein J0M18_07325 [Ignavibacteria bacterium]|nr:hypothetical protein [Ignavibacteria bacterium]